MAEPKRNAEEGGRAAFWGNDIDSEDDEEWAKRAAAILVKPKKKLKSLSLKLHGKKRRK